MRSSLFDTPHPPLPVTDQRVHRTRSGFVTVFLREVRAMLDEVGKAQGRYIPNCCLVPVTGSPPSIPVGAGASSLGERLANALDVPTWIQEGLTGF